MAAIALPDRAGCPLADVYSSVRVLQGISP